MRSLRLLLIPALAVSIASAQTPAKKPAPSAARTTHSAAHSTAAHSAGACVQVPELSPKIPALPPGTPCPKSLYTITTTPSAHLEGLSPMEPSTLPSYLGIVPNTFTLAYIDTQVGTGPLAGPHQYYSINYTGYLVDGTKFDSSFDHKPAEPLTIPYGERKVIPGWDTGFAGMHVGGKRRLFIPYELAYGSNGSGPIPPKAELIFDVELVGVSDTPPPPPVRLAPPAQPSANPLSSRPGAAPAARPAAESPAKPAEPNPAKP